MDNELRKRLSEIEIEDVVLGIFVVVIILSYIANQIEKNYFINRCELDKRRYYYIQIIVFLIVLIVNFYYVLNSYYDLSTVSFYDSYKRKKYAYLDFIAGLFALVAIFIVFYFAITDKDIDAEISL